MAFKTCPNCGNKVPTTNVVCPHCGYRFKQNANGGMLLALALVLAIVFAPVIIVLGLFGKFLLKGLYKNILGLEEFKKFRKTYTIICFSWLFLSIAFIVVCVVLQLEIAEYAFYVLCGGNIALFALSIVFGNKIYKKHKDDIPTDSNTAKEVDSEAELIETEDTTTESATEESSNSSAGMFGSNEYDNKKKKFELLAELAALRDANVLTEEEFNEQKQQILRASCESVPQTVIFGMANGKRPASKVEENTVSDEKPNTSKEQKQAPSKKAKRASVIVCATVLVVGTIVGILIVALQHRHNFEDEIIVPPTCEEEGYTKHVCDCGEWYSDTIVSATGHSIENGICTNCDYSELQYTLSASGDSYIFEHGAGGNVVILSEYNGLPVTAIGDSAFENCTGLLSVTIPDSITSIGDSAFLGCTSLTSVTIPDSVTSIGNKAFEGCIYFKSVIIPDSVTSIGREVFSGCDAISKIALPFIGTSEEGTFNTQFGNLFGDVNWAQDNLSVPSSLKKVIITSGAEIGDYAFYGCSSIESITIPESVTSIGYQAFAECTGLTEINFNATDCVISYDVYSHNSPFINSGDGVTGIVLNIGDNVKQIPNCLFNASNVSSIKIGKSLTSIGDYAFSRCESLTEVTIPGNVLNIGRYAFDHCYDLCELTIEEGVKSIGDYAFESCAELTEISIPNSIENIGHHAFFACDSLRYNSEGDLNYLGNNSNKYLFLINAPIGIRTATINENCKIISSSAFYDCSLLTSVTIPEGVTSIGDYAFSGCSSLESITLPDSVKIIGTTAFRDCRSLTSIVIPDSVTNMGYDAFYWCTLTIYCEASQKPDGWDSDWNCDYDNSINNGEKSYLTVFWKGQWQYDENGIPVPLS